MPLGHNKNASLFYTFTRENLVFLSPCTKFSVRCANTEFRLRLGNTQINLVFRSPCTKFVTKMN